MRPTFSLQRSLLLSLAGGCAFRLAVMIAAASTFVTGSPGQEPLTIVIAGQIELARLVDMCSQRLEIAIEYDPAVLKGSTTIRAPAALNNDELWRLTNQLLVARGFTTVIRPGLSTYSTVQLTTAASMARIETGDLPKYPPGFQKILLPVQFREPARIAEALRPLITPTTGSATAIPDVNAILIADIDPKIAEIKAILPRLDIPAESTVIEIHLEASTAQQMVPLLTKLSAQKPDGASLKIRGEILAGTDENTIVVIAPKEFHAAWKELVATLDKRAQTQTLTYTPATFPAGEVAKLIQDTLGTTTSSSGSTLRVVVDELTQSLIVTGTDFQQEQIKEILNRLDAVATNGTRQIRAFPIRNRPVEDVLQTLSQLIEAVDVGIVDEDSKRREITASADQRQFRQPSATFEPSSVLPSKPTGSGGGNVDGNGGGGGYGESGSRRDFGRAASQNFSFTADKATNTLIAVGEPRLLFQVEKLLQFVDVRQSQVMIDVLLVSLTDSQSLTLGVELQKLGSLGDATTKLASLFGLGAGAPSAAAVGGQGFTGAIINPGEFSVIIRALEGITGGRTYTSPKLLISNNEQATFSSTIQQPVLTTLRDSGETIQSYGGSESAGTTVAIRPQISQSDTLNLTYSIRLSSFLEGGGDGLPPPKQENSVDSVAVIPDGYTVVVGGLELTTNANSESRVPILGAIPGLGHLFKSQNKSNNRTRFFVFIRANILRNASFEDLKYLSTTDSTTMNVPDGFPVVKPRVIR